MTLRVLFYRVNSATRSGRQLAGAAWACKNKALFEGKRVLELGAAWAIWVPVRPSRTPRITLTDPTLYDRTSTRRPDAKRTACIANGLSTSTRNGSTGRIELA